MERLKVKWGVDSTWRLCIIFLVFALTGTTAAKFGGPLTEYFGVSKNLNPYLFWPTRIIIILPIYKVLLLIFGWLFGEFLFFRQFAIKILRYLGLGFLFK